MHPKMGLTLSIPHLMPPKPPWQTTQILLGPPQTRQVNLGLGRLLPLLAAPPPAKSSRLCRLQEQGLGPEVKERPHDGGGSAHTATSPGRCCSCSGQREIKETGGCDDGACYFVVNIRTAN
jgi:hypothetical protein